MNAKSFANLMVLMLVATIALEASVAETQTIWCKIKCGVDCLGALDEPICFSQCLKDCGGASKVETLEGQCNLGCVVSKCFDLRPAADSKKVKGCVNSCMEGCKKF